MWVIKVNGTDFSRHTQQNDADDQKTRMIANGVLESTIQLLKQDTFNPPQLS